MDAHESDRWVRMFSLFDVLPNNSYCSPTQEYAFRGCFLFSHQTWWLNSSLQWLRHCGCKWGACIKASGWLIDWLFTDQDVLWGSISIPIKEKNIKDITDNSLDLFTAQIDLNQPVCWWYSELQLHYILIRLTLPYLSRDKVQREK